VNIDRIQLEDGKTIPASQYGQNVELVAVGELNATEQQMIEKVKVHVNKKNQLIFFFFTH